MTTKTSRALMAAAFLASCASAALFAAPAQAADSLTPAVANHLVDAQNDLKKNPPDLAKANADLAAAAGVSSRKPYDDYMIAFMKRSLAATAHDDAGILAAAEAMADSPAQPEADKMANLNIAMGLNMQGKHYDNAVKYAKLLEAANPTDPKMRFNILQAYYFSGDNAAAKDKAAALVDADVKAGRTPDYGTLQMQMSAAANLKDEVGAETVLEQMVVSYNHPDDWAQMIDIAFGTQGLRDVDAVWLGRLLFLVGAPVSQNNGNMIGSIASHLTFFGDAVNAKAHGGVVDPDPAPRADADKKTIDKQIADEDKQNGVYSAKLAEALYSYAMYPEAEAAAQKAMTKGGNPDASEAPMVLGQAQAAQGKFDDALASFGKVSGGGPATARIAKLWVDYVTVKKRPPAAAAQAAK